MGQIKMQKDFGGLIGLTIIEPYCHIDARGYFLETYNQKDLNENGLNMFFVQDNQSLSKKGVLRGLHYQKNHPQGKLLRVIKGSVYDVAVDLRKGSSTFQKWCGLEISAENKKQIYIPEGFAHGFIVLSDEAEVFYKVTDYWYPGDECGIIWNDPDIGIQWPLEEGVEIILSQKDKDNLTLRDSIQQNFVK